LRRLREEARKHELERLRAPIAELERRAALGDEDAAREIEDVLRRIAEVHRAARPLQKS
jgi:hypothetical protein